MAALLIALMLDVLSKSACQVTRSFLPD